MPVDVPELFSVNFSPVQFAHWMKVRKFLSDYDCNIIIGESMCS